MLVKRVLMALVKEPFGTWVLMAAVVFVVLAWIRPLMIVEASLPSIIATLLGCCTVVAVPLGVIRLRYVSYDPQKSVIFIEVGPDGKVIGWGNPLWRARRGTIHRCGLPRKWAHPLKTKVELSWPMGMGLSVNVALSAIFTEPFDPQNVYDTVVELGYAGVEEWLGSNFQAAALSSAGVKQAVEEFTTTLNSDPVAEALKGVLEEPPFSKRPLRNLGRIAVTTLITLDAPRKEVSYS